MHIPMPRRTPVPLFPNIGYQALYLMLVYSLAAYNDTESKSDIRNSDHVVQVTKLLQGLTLRFLSNSH